MLRLRPTPALKQKIPFWSDFSKRSPSLGVSNSKLKSAILTGVSEKGPYTLKRKFNKLKYSSPEAMDEVFKLSYSFLETKAANASDAVGAEINNPEVLYNFEYKDKHSGIIDYEQPVYRALASEHWAGYNKMLTMQRLESLHVIPDTMPTLDPKVDVLVQFPLSTGVNKWIVPGEVLSSNVTKLAPVVKIQRFTDTVETSAISASGSTEQFTVLIVNPDEPDVANDSYKTTLQYGLANCNVGFTSNVVDGAKGDASVFASYLPPVPEKNTGKHRFCVWVFKQSKPLEIGNVERERFNVREFAEQHGLVAVGAHVWRSEHDAGVAQVRELYNLPAGRVFHRVRR